MYWSQAVIICIKNPFSKPTVFNPKEKRKASAALTAHGIRRSNHCVVIKIFHFYKTNDTEEPVTFLVRTSERTLHS